MLLLRKANLADLSSLLIGWKKKKSGNDHDLYYKQEKFSSIRTTTEERWEAAAMHLIYFPAGRPGSP